jgi:heme O synthase-like polyprenyltransferase
MVIEDLAVLWEILCWIVRVGAMLFVECFALVFFCGPAVGVVWVGIRGVVAIREDLTASRNSQERDNDTESTRTQRRPISGKCIAATSIALLAWLMLLHVTLLLANVGITAGTPESLSGAARMLHSIASEESEGS